MKWLIFGISFIALVNSIENAKILGIFPLPSKSHFVLFERICKELASRGHEVDVVSHFPLKTPVPRYNDLSLVGSQQIFVNNLTINQVKFSSHYDFLDFMIIGCGVFPCQASFETKLLQDLRFTTKKYDLLLHELFTADCMIGFSHLFKIPVVSLTSSVNLPWASDRFGNPDNPSYIPTYFTNYVSRMTLKERIFNTIDLILSKLAFKVMSVSPTNKLSKQFFGDDLPDIQDLVYNTSVLLVNSHFSIHQPRPAVPGFVEIGGAHIVEPKPLSKYFKDLLQTDTKGIIYLSMGSMVKTESFPIHKIQALFDALAELPYKVIWKADKEQFPKEVKFAKNIHFEKWMPQLDILCHPNVKLFISHGGLMGTQETVYCGVPQLGIPIFADQDFNIRQTSNRGLAIKVDFDAISKEAILTAAKELLSNPKYKENCETSAKIFKDRPLKPLDTAIYWIEYVIRHKGAKHLRSAAADLYWFQYYLLDVGFILASITFLTIYLVIKILKLFFGKTSKTKTE